MLSMIIPSDKDYLLQKTIDSLLENAEGEIEVIPILDGHEQPIKKDSRVKPIYFNVNKGTRAAINAGLAVSKGDYIAKIDSHCIVAESFDKILLENIEKNWLVVPRRYSLHEKTGTRHEERPICDYHFLNFPVDSDYGYGMFAQPEFSRSHHFRKESLIDDTMTFQASFWLANKDYFMKHVGFLDNSPEAYGPFGGEYIETVLKYWLGGGEVKVNKMTWYAHLCKRSYHYKQGIYTKRYKKNTNKNRDWSSKHWINNKEPNMIHSFSWLIKKFWPIKTWPENWQEIWNNYKL